MIRNFNIFINKIRNIFFYKLKNFLFFWVKKFISKFFYLKRTINFTRIYFLLFRLVRKFDRNAPFKGHLGENKGFYDFNLVVPNDMTKKIDLIYENYKKNNCLKIKPNDFDVFVKILEVTKKSIKDYLGSDVKLDGINFLIRSKKTIATEGAFSGYWHTDNVGARLKVFVCFRGDGSQPTLIIPPKRILPGFTYLIFAYFIELIRWLNFKNTFQLFREVKLSHRKGSIIALDTQILHRGGWEKSNEERRLLVLEFSNPKKHTLMKGLLSGPIGTKEYNSFDFHPDFLKEKNISDLIDKKRLQIKINNYLTYR